MSFSSSNPPLFREIENIYWSSTFYQQIDEKVSVLYFILTIFFIIIINFLFSQESKSTLLLCLTFKSSVFTSTKDSFWTFSTLSPCTTVLKPTLKTRALFHARLWLVARLPLGKVLSFLEACFDLISGKSKVQIPAQEGQKIFVLFFFIFKFFTQNWVSLILTTFWYLYV